MNVYVFCSDYYNPIIPAFAYMFNLYWPNQNVVILCYTVPDCKLPPNFSIQSLGSSVEFGNDQPEWSVGRRGIYMGELYPTHKWTDSVIRWVNGIDDPYFVLLLVDYFLYAPVDVGRIKRLAGYIGKLNPLDGRKLVKVALNGSGTWCGHVKDFTIDRVILCDSPTTRCLEIGTDYDCRLGLEPALWDTEYFKSILVPGRSPWNHEMDATQQFKNDNVLVEWADIDKGVIPYINIYKTGHVCWAELARIDPPILQELFAGWLISNQWNGLDRP